MYKKPLKAHITRQKKKQKEKYDTFHLFHLHFIILQPVIKNHKKPPLLRMKNTGFDSQKKKSNQKHMVQ